MNAAEDLKQIFNDRYPRAIDVAKRYLDITDKKVLNNKITSGGLGFPVFKAGKSNKAPWLVDVVDLAKWLEKQRNISAQ